MLNTVLTEECGIPLADKYAVFEESCDHFNERTLFHSGYFQIETKHKMLEDATWKYQQRSASVWRMQTASSPARKIRVGLGGCTVSVFAVGTVFIIHSQSALHVLLCAASYLIALCLLICFVRHTTDSIVDKCCPRKLDRKMVRSGTTMTAMTAMTAVAGDSLLSVEDFTTAMTRSSGLYFDEKQRAVYDLTVLVNYSEKTRHEKIYEQRRERLFAFDDILEIGYNEASNEPDWSEYAVYESLPSFSYNVTENDFCALIIEYRETPNQQQRPKRKRESFAALGLAAHHGTVEREGVGRWQDGKLSKGEFMQKMEELRAILKVVGLSDTVTVRKTPYQRFHKNPVTKHKEQEGNS